MRAILGAAVLALVACGGNTGGDDGGDDGKGPDACVGLECKVVNCGAQQKQPTTLTGTVFAPNGTLPLFGVNVYVPRDPVGAFPDGAQCSRCSDELPGSPIARTQTNEKGEFTLENVPANSEITLIVTSGKWRRQYKVASAPECTSTAIDPQNTRFPKNKAEGDIPKIALTTGSADSMECLVRKLGIEDAELTNDSGTGRVNYFVGAVGTARQGVASSANGNFADARTLWGDANKLKGYDIVFLSCEGDQVEAQKPLDAMMNMKGYADIGGRVFASHWHNIWVGGNFRGNGQVKPPVWSDIATWTGNDNNISGSFFIDEASNGKGPAFAQWMLNVGGSPTRDQIPITGDTGRSTALTVDGAKAERWVTRDRNGGRPEMFQFTTPNEVVADQRCGKVVFTDMHVSGDSDLPNTFPNNCAGGAGNLSLTPQEKALAFMFFDISSCVGGIF